MSPEQLEMPLSALRSLVGHRFPGGTYRVEHWENWLLTDCTGRTPMPGGLVHPIVLFHAPIVGAGVSIQELFRLGRASGEPGSVTLLGYDFEYLDAIREGVEYRASGAIIAADRHTTASGTVHDDVSFRIDLSSDGAVAARATYRWRFWRALPPPRQPLAPPAPTGALIPSWEMASVDAARMKTMAAILRDPYPVHWDRVGNERLGLGGRVVNQGPLNLGYIANMLMAWAGDAAIRRLTVAFGRQVLDGDRVVAAGCVRDLRDGVAFCDVWLGRGDEGVVVGTAELDAGALTGGGE